MLNHLNIAILREISRVAAQIAEDGIADGSHLTETYEYIDADTLTMVLHDIRESIGDLKHESKGNKSR